MIAEKITKSLMRYFFPLFVVLLCLVGVATAIEENTYTVTYKLGSHNISFQLNNSDEYKTIIEPPAYSSESKSWTYYMNITQSADNYITFNIHEYTGAFL